MWTVLGEFRAARVQLCSWMRDFGVETASISLPVGRILRALSLSLYLSLCTYMCHMCICHVCFNTQNWLCQKA